MKKITAFTTLLITSLVLVQCNQTQDNNGHHMMNEGQMSQFMQNPEQRQAMMTQMMQNPEIRDEFMNQMHTTMMSGDYQDQTLDRMEAMMNNPEQRDLMKAHMQRMVEMLDSEEFNRGQMREIMEQSPMMGMHLNCLQMLKGSE